MKRSHTRSALRKERIPLVAVIGAVALAFALAGCGKKSTASTRDAGATSSTNTAPAQPNAAAAGAAPSADTLALGEQVYLKNCAQCHMADGGGVPNMQPELVGSPIVTGDPTKLEAVIRSGSAALRDRKSDFQNEMPPFAMLSDAEVKAVIAYVREKFGKPAGNGAP